MKTLKIAILAFLLGLPALAQDAEQMVFLNDLKEATGKLGNSTTMLLRGDKSRGIKNEFYDANDFEAAILRITVKNMPLSSMKTLKFEGSPNNAVRLVRGGFMENEQQWYVAVSLGESMYLEAISDTYGKSSRLHFDNLKANTLYDVTLVNNETTNITVNTVPEGISAYIDGDLKGKTNCTIENITFGNHILELRQGNIYKKDTISVAKGNTLFSYDLQQRIKVTITSDPKGAAIYVDTVFIGKAPVDYEVVPGAHTFRAELSATQVDEQAITVGQGTTTIALNPIKKGNVAVTAKYVGRPTSFDLVIDNQQREAGNYEYQVALPYGMHTFRASVAGKTKEKRLKVYKPEMPLSFKFTEKSESVTPWQKGYEQKSFDFSIGYVRKQLVAKNGSTKFECDGGYYRSGEALHGMQMRFNWHPLILPTCGLGAYTGLGLSMYMTWTDNPNRADEEFKYFTEYELNVPAHIYWWVPLSEDVNIALHTGLGIDLGLYAAYSDGFLGLSQNDGDSYDTHEVIDDYYGKKNGGPGAFNLTYDFAVSLNFNHIGVNAYWQRGLLNHKGIFDWDYGKGRTVENKFGLSVSYIF